MAYDCVARVVRGTAGALLQFGPKRTVIFIAIVSTCTYIYLYSFHYNRHTEGVNKFNNSAPPLGSQFIAICMGICYRGKALEDILKRRSETEMFSAFLPSFCSSISKGYKYHFYLAYDFDDPFLSTSTGFNLFRKTFSDVIKKHCTYSRNITLNMVMLPYSGKPAWAQNDACMEAYMDGAEYLYRVNDDTVFSSSGWSEHFIQTLWKYTPPNIGVVGPTHTFGNAAILTYDFTHRTHIEIFGVHYPRIYRAWFADDWITHIYQPKRTTKLRYVTLKHTGKYGTRYRLHKQFWSQFQNVEQRSKLLLERYIRYKTSSRSRVATDGKKVVSMSLYGNNRTYTYGAIRNAQLLPVVYPGWTLRVYVPVPRSPFAVPDKIIRSLLRLSVDVREINASKTNIPLDMWRLLVADDPTIEYFVIRDADGRLSQRDYDITRRKFEHDEPFFCVRDHVTHCNCAIPKGLWGGKPAWFRVPQMMKSNHTLLETSKLGEKHFLSETFKMRNSSIRGKCENLIKCEGSHIAHSENTSAPLVYIGKLYDEFGESRKAQNRCV